MAVYRDLRPERQLNWWDGKFHNPITKMHKISLCTVCMGRADDVKLTIPVNMRDNEDHPDVEFVLLNYGSQDDLDTWVKTDPYMQEQMACGKLLYVHTTEPKYFNFTHSRNIAMKAASGTVVANVDADNFTKKGFATFLNKCANECPEKMLSHKIVEIHGRVGFFKQEFVELLGGYDEDMVGYGIEDRDIVRRAAALGFVTMHYGRDFFSRNMFDRIDGRPIVINLEEKYQKTCMMKTYRGLSARNISTGKLKANAGCPWGAADLIVNFTREMHT